MNPIQQFYREAWFTVNELDGVIHKFRMWERESIGRQEEFTFAMMKAAQTAPSKDLFNRAITSTDDADLRNRIERLRDCLVTFANFSFVGNKSKEWQTCRGEIQKAFENLEPFITIDPVPEGKKFANPAHVPKEFREGGKENGEILTAPYLKDSPNWFLIGSYLTKNYGAGKILTTHIKVNRAKAYLYTELLALRDKKASSDNEGH